MENTLPEREEGTTISESLVSKCQNMNSLVKWFEFIVDAETSSNVPVLQFQVNKHAEDSTQIFVQISAFHVFCHI